MIGNLLAASCLGIVALAAGATTYDALEAQSAQAVLVASAQNLQTDASYFAQLNQRPETSADLQVALSEVPADVQAGYTITVSDAAHATLTAAAGSVCIESDTGTITNGAC
jgi:hypothetical protein